MAVTQNTGVHERVALDSLRRGLGYSGSIFWRSLSRSNHAHTTSKAAARSSSNLFIKYGMAPYMLVRPSARNRRR